MQHPVKQAPFRLETYRLLLLLSGILVGLLGTGREVAALPEFRDAALKTYGFKPGGALDKASCNLCHTSVPQLNPYGASIKAVLSKPPPKTLTAEFLHSLDSADADGDGFPNGDELKADTLPGDPASHPPGAPPPPKIHPSPNMPAAASGEISPFDIQKALTSQNAQHPALVHFPIALFLVSLLFDLLAIWKKNDTLASAGYLNLVVAALSALAAVATGLIAWLWKYGGISLQGNLLLHLIFGSVSALLICLLWGIRYQQRKRGKQELGWIYLVIGLIVAMTIALTGHIGGILTNVVG